MSQPENGAAPPEHATDESSDEAELRTLRQYVTADGQLDLDEGAFKDCLDKWGPDHFARAVSRLIVADDLPFPYKKHFMTETGSLTDKFGNLRAYKGQVQPLVGWVNQRHGVGLPVWGGGGGGAAAKGDYDMSLKSFSL